MMDTTSSGTGTGTEGLWLGFYTGGTYTDAVLLAGGRHVVASAKELTTPWDLAIGISKALCAVLDALPAGASRADVTLVSVSRPTPSSRIGSARCARS
jgi:N-methylhydantoinase A/oxoprolinase/acetone carboxylase beta subunit